MQQLAAEQCLQQGFTALMAGAGDLFDGLRLDVEVAAFELGQRRAQGLLFGNRLLALGRRCGLPGVAGRISGGLRRRRAGNAEQYKNQ